MTAYSTVQNASPSHIATVFRGVPQAITPTDNAAIGPFTCLYVGSGGDVAVVPVGSNTAVVFKAVPTGTLLPVQFQGINATNTTASSLVGLG